MESLPVARVFSFIRWLDLIGLDMGLTGHEFFDQLLSQCLVCCYPFFLYRLKEMHTIRLLGIKEWFGS